MTKKNPLSQAQRIKAPVGVHLKKVTVPADPGVHLVVDIDGETVHVHDIVDHGVSAKSLTIGGKFKDIPLSTLLRDRAQIEDY